MDKLKEKYTGNPIQDENANANANVRLSGGEGLEWRRVSLVPLYWFFEIF